MTFVHVISLAILATTSLTITEPQDGETYDGDWLPLRVIVENENTLPDSVHYTLNGEAAILIPRLSTDWYTYMQNSLHHGFSESPAPMTDEILWTAPVTGFMHEFPNPIVVDGIVYYPSDSGDLKLHALDAATGEEIWSYVMMGSDDPPSYSEGRLFIASDSVYCIDALTGERIWAFVNAEEDFRSGSTPCVMESRVACAGNKDPAMESTVYCLSTGDGEVLWERPLQGRVMNCIAGWNGMFFVGTWHGPLYAIDAATGETVWANSDAPSGYFDSSPVIVDGGVYTGGDDGCVRRFDALTGAMDWMTPIGLSIQATPAVYGQAVICGSNNHPDAGVLALLSMSDGSILWSIPMNIHGSPAVADGVVYWGGCWEPFDIIYAADAATGEMIWSFDPDAGVIGLQSTPAITDGVMYYASTDGNLYAFGTGLKYTYREEYFYTEVGANTLIATSFDEGEAVAADTISFTVTGTGFGTEPSPRLHLTVSPNPFHSAGSISFELTDPGDTNLEIYDLTGRMVWSRAEGLLDAGQHTYTWDCRGETGELLSSGLYLCRIRSGRILETTGMCLLR